MSTIIKKYTDIIHIQSRMLIDSDQTFMLMAQREAVERINRYASVLAMTANQETYTDDEQMILRHELINILTPIVGYIEMLSDGWIGSLNPDQVDHLEIIHQSVNALRREVLAQRHKTHIFESA